MYVYYDIGWVEMESLMKVAQPLTAGTEHQNILHEMIQNSITTNCSWKNEETDGHWIHTMEKQCKLKHSCLYCNNVKCDQMWTIVVKQS
jgi:hypothetical protein